MEENQNQSFLYPLHPLLQGCNSLATAPSMFFCSCHCEGLQGQQNCPQRQKIEQIKKRIPRFGEGSSLGMRELLAQVADEVGLLEVYSLNIYNV
jgi:hypothetical protein